MKLSQEIHALGPYIITMHVCVRLCNLLRNAIN